MASISWPSELPVTLKSEGLSVQYKDPVIRTEMDAGPQKARLRYTGSPQGITGSLTLNEYQRGILEYFFTKTTGFGTLRFNMVHPQTIELVEMRFTRPPIETGNGGGLFDISLSLEKI